VSATPADDRPPPPSPGRLARLRQAPATTGLLVALVLAFLASARDPGVFERFAKMSDRVREGEYWRLVTASFLHGGLLHIAVNAYALSMIGPTVERLYGGVRFLLIFVVGGAIGFAASTAFVAQPSVGASAGLFALLGVLLGFAVRSRRTLPRRARRAMIQEILTVAALNIGLGLMVPFIDNAAHVGGFAGGLALGIVLRPRSAD
jgi:membrane associated rhomboid family serine protease